jgi:stage V sporulation protein K
MQIVQDIQKLPGMENIKDQVDGLVAQAITNKVREREGLPPEPFINHMLMVGSPGTGKTMVTKKIGELMHELGLTKNPQVKQLTRAELTGKYVNEAADTTNKLITQNRGKTIFIDEAYSLYTGPEDREGKQVVDELMRLAEEYGRDTSIILAGYPRHMEEFFEVNPGLKSRFSNKIELKDLTPQAKTQVMHYMVEDNNRTYANGTVKKRAGQYAAMLPSEGEHGNARAVRSFYDLMRGEHARRIAGAHEGVTAKELAEFTRKDVEAAAARMGLPPIVTVRKPKKKAAANRANAQRRLRAVVEKPPVAVAG